MFFFLVFINLLRYSFIRYLTFFYLLAACRYEKGTWGECNAQSQMTRNDKLKPNSDPSCEQNRQITKKCKPKGIKPTKGKGKRIVSSIFIFNLFTITIYLFFVTSITLQTSFVFIKFA